MGADDGLRRAEELHHQLRRAREAAGENLDFDTIHCEAAVIFQSICQSISVKSSSTIEPGSPSVCVLGFERFGTTQAVGHYAQTHSKADDSSCPVNCGKHFTKFLGCGRVGATRKTWSQILVYSRAH